AKLLRKNNESAWEIINTSKPAGTSESINESFFIVLRQSDSSLYICHGQGEGKNRTVRYVLKLKAYKEIEIQPTDHSTVMASVNLTQKAKEKFSNQAINKYSYFSSMLHIPMIKIDSLEQFNEFKKEFADSLKTSPFLEGERDFFSATSDCDKAFFETDSLLLSYIYAGSTDYRYESIGIYRDRNEFQITFVLTSLPVGDTAIADWIAVTKIKKRIISDCDTYSAIVNYNLIYSTYEYINEQGDKASLYLGKDKTFQFNYSQLSSYIASGNYVLDGDEIVLTDKEKKGNKYRFKNNGNSFIFLADKSTPLPKYSYSANSKPISSVPDKAEFLYNP
ncbi:MAG: hypothetical protein IKK24_01160, partial [Clostridia bacterium]|nr:hypothetical protein [Clostridia bacterium]